MQQWSANVQWEASRHLLVDVRYVGSRGQDLLGKVNLAVPVDPRATPVNGFTDIYDSQRRLINPDFFVPAEFLGLNRNGGFQQLTNVGRSTYHSLQTNVRGRFGTRAFLQAGYTFGKSLDTLSSVLSYHNYRAEHIRADYGHEWNLQVAATWKRFNVMLKYADYYRGAGLPNVRDTDKLWAQVEFVW